MPKRSDVTHECSLLNMDFYKSRYTAPPGLWLTRINDSSDISTIQGMTKDKALVDTLSCSLETPNPWPARPGSRPYPWSLIPNTVLVVSY